jgi:hypothetical protein
MAVVRLTVSASCGRRSRESSRPLEVRFIPCGAHTEGVADTKGVLFGVKLTLQAPRATGLEFKLVRASLNRGKTATFAVHGGQVRGALLLAAVAEIVVAPPEMVSSGNSGALGAIKWGGASEAAKARSQTGNTFSHHVLFDS